MPESPTPQAHKAACPRMFDRILLFNPQGPKTGFVHSSDGLLFFRTASTTQKASWFVDWRLEGGRKFHSIPKNGISDTTSA